MACSEQPLPYCSPRNREREALWAVASKKCGNTPLIFLGPDARVRPLLSSGVKTAGQRRRGAITGYVLVRSRAALLMVAAPPPVSPARKLTKCRNRKRGV